jgi:hypothetical protein
VRLCGLRAEELEEGKVLDEVVGLAQIWRLTSGARVLTF